MNKPQPPMQPIYVAEDGVIRFRENAIIRWLMDTRKIDLNEIAAHRHEFPVEDIEQFWQRLGYSVSGYGDLSFIRPETVSAADKIADSL